MYLFLFLLSIAQVHAANWIDGFLSSPACAEILNGANHRYKKDLIRVYKSYAAEGRPRVEGFLEGMGDDELTDHFTYSLRRYLDFQGERFPVLAVLDMDDQGVNYVVNRGDKPVILREYFDWATITSYAFHHLTRFGDLEVLAYEGNFFMLEFVPGIPLAILMSDTDLNALGIPFQKAITMSDWYRRRFGSEPSEYLILDIRTGEPVNIDPR